MVGAMHMPHGLRHVVDDGVLQLQTVHPSPQEETHPNAALLEP